MAVQRHLIKKYANRKLYDTQDSQYVTLEGISKLLGSLSEELKREKRDSNVIDVPQS